jgi:3-phenylpropionate/trans-cinnamate dioxygenase ferredoxin reductase subunit
MSYRTIVMGTDGSITASMAQDAAVRLAKRSRARLILITAYSPPQLTRRVAEQVLERARQDAERQRVRVEVELDTGDPAELILGAAERHRADLVVVGNKGMGRATRFRLGSVPDKVAHFAPCDLLIVDTTRATDPDARNRPYRRIVVATDGSPTASEASRRGMETAAIFGADATLVYVGDPILGAIAVEQTAAAGPEGVDIRPRVVQGEAAEMICRVADDEGADLIVVGNRGMAGARRFLIGSVPNKVAHYASTDVLIVKTMDRSLDDLEPGHGGVFQVDGKRAAVFRDEGGGLHMVSARCTHMGCTVDWNDAEKTWDCPCHGSRYAADGAVLQGPAQRRLDPIGNAPEEVPQVAAVQSTEAATASPARGPRAAERFVVVGASLAGATAASTLRQEGFDGRLVLVGSEPSFPYERPPLSKGFLRGETTFQEALVNPPAFYADNQIETWFGTTALSVDPQARTLAVAGGEPITYDRLLIATGARNRRFPIPGLSLAGVYELRSVEDAARIRAEIVPGRRAALVGMGFIGSEVAASLRRRGVGVTVVDGGSVPLERVLGAEVGAVMAAIHADHGVKMVFGDTVASFEGSARVERVVTGKGREIECDFAVVGVGVQPQTDLVAGSGIAVDNGILVDQFCRTNVDGVYAAGDVANHWHPVFGRRIRTEHWHNAIKQGHAAALNMMDRNEPYEDVHWFWSDQYDHRIEYAGFHTEWDDIVIRGSLPARDFAAFYMKDGRVQAVVALDRGEDVRRSIALIRAGGPMDPDRLRDEDADLPALVTTSPAGDGTEPSR